MGTNPVAGALVPRGCPLRWQRGQGWWHGAGNRRGHRPAGPSEGQCGFVRPVPSGMGSRARKTRGLRDGMTRCRLALPPPGTAPPQPPGLPERDDAAGQPLPVPEALLHRVGAGDTVASVASALSRCSGGGSSPSPLRWRLREGTGSGWPSLCPCCCSLSHDPAARGAAGWVRRPRPAWGHCRVTIPVPCPLWMHMAAR